MKTRTNLDAVSFFIFFIIAVVIGLSFSTCNVSDAEVNRVLRAQGFSDVKTDGHAWFACSKGDTFATKFTATNATGQPVEGAVCCGVVKSCTVRF